MVSSMRRAAFLLPLMGFAGSSSAQVAVQPSYAPSYQAQAGNVGYALNDWRRLRQSEGYSFGDYARFLIYNPDWPGESAMRRSAEKAMRPGENAATVLAFFRSDPPLSGNGFARYAEALSATGRATEALEAARKAWASPDLSAYDEQSFYARFGTSLTFADHERRADALLFDKKASDAQRFLSLVGAARRPAFAARVAMQTRSPNAEYLYQQAQHRVAADAGLLMDRARYLRDGGNEQLARSLFARPHGFTERPADVERFYEMQLLLAEGAARSGQWTTAFNIARQLDDSFAPGTDITTQPYGVRDEYTSLAWLAGTAALQAVGRPADAVAMFHRYAKGGKSLQVLSKGYYWAGRAALAARKPAEATAYFTAAGGYPELFYGQLALERLGRTVPAPQYAATGTVAPALRAQFGANRLVQATRVLGSQGRRDEQALFVRALAESLKTRDERLLAVELAQQIGRQDLNVWVARSARNNGEAFYVRQAFPTHSSSVPSGRIWSLAHGITRQESSFDRTAISHAGARGLMQLMPGTAREQAGKMGYGYDYGRLTSDPTYNVMLGSAYFQRMLNTWGGNVPLAVASYNAGAGNVRKWVNAYGDPRGGTDVLRWIEQIPFTETRGYVQRVIENSVVYDSLNPSPQPATAMHVSRYLGKGAPG